MIFIEVLTLGGIMVEICMFLRKVIALGESTPPRHMLGHKVMTFGEITSLDRMI